MRAPSRNLHRLQAAAAIFGTIAAVFGVSRLVKPEKVESRAIALSTAQLVPIVPRVDPAPEQPEVARAPATDPELLQAASDGDIAAMEKAYRPGMPIAGALGAAAENDHPKAIEWLLDHGADPNEDASLITTVDDHPEVTSVLLARGTNEATLTDAAAAGAKNAVTRILAKNAGLDVNAEIDGVVPMDAAISGGRGEIVRALIARGAKVTGEQLADAVTATAPAESGPVLDALLTANIPPRELSKAFEAAAGEGSPPLVKRLAAKGALWSWRDDQGDQHMPLVDAIDRQDFAVVRAMVEAGAPVNLATELGRTPLGAAIQIGATDDAMRIVRTLLDRGADPNRRVDTGERPLARAAMNGDARIVTLLLDHGARVNDGLGAADDETALEAAETLGYSDVARVLRAHGARRRPTADR